MVDLTELQKIKDKGTHRYWLWRENKHRTAESTKIAAWVLCNPSWSRRLVTDGRMPYLQKQGNSTVTRCTRDYDDPTVEYVQYLTFYKLFSGHVYKGLFVLNLYPYRTSKPEHLKGKKESELGYSHSNQTDSLKEIFSCKPDLFFAWGNIAVENVDSPHFEKARDSVVDLAMQAGLSEYFYFDKTQKNEPMHPRHFWQGKEALPDPIPPEELCKLKI